MWSVSRQDDWANTFERFDRMFSNLEEFGKKNRGESKVEFPRVDAIDYDDKVVMEADLPGLKQGEVTVQINEGVLTIRGGKQETNEPADKKARYIFKEIKRSSFERSWTLDSSIDQTKAIAVFENGKLTITLPKLSVRPPKQIKLL